MRTIFVVAPLCAVSLAGCAKDLGSWSKADMSAFNRDNYECRREATFVRLTDTETDTKLYRLCMKARGYVEASETGGPKR